MIDNEDGLLLTGIHEYHEGSPVYMYKRNDNKIVIVAYNEGGHNSTEVDLLDLLKWLIVNMPNAIDELYKKVHNGK